MYIIKTDDSLYPIKFDDSWGGVAYLGLYTITNDDEWNAFLEKLKELREEIKKEKR